MHNRTSVRRVNDGIRPAPALRVIHRHRFEQGSAKHHRSVWVMPCTRIDDGGTPTTRRAPRGSNRHRDKQGPGCRLRRCLPFLAHASLHGIAPCDDGRRLGVRTGVVEHRRGQHLLPSSLGTQGRDFRAFDRSCYHGGEWHRRFKRDSMRTASPVGRVSAGLHATSESQLVW